MEKKTSHLNQMEYHLKIKQDNNNNNRYSRLWVFRNQIGWGKAMKNRKESVLVEEEHSSSDIIWQNEFEDTSSGWSLD